MIVNRQPADNLTPETMWWACNVGVSSLNPFLFDGKVCKGGSNVWLWTVRLFMQLCVSVHEPNRHYSSGYADKNYVTVCAVKCLTLVEVVTCTEEYWDVWADWLFWQDCCFELWRLGLLRKGLAELLDRSLCLQVCRYNPMPNQNLQMWDLPSASPNKQHAL